MKLSKKILIVTAFMYVGTQAIAQKKLAELQFVSLHPKPVITKNTKGAEDIKYGFEGGSCLKVGSQYYLFTTENFAEPKTAAVRLALWKSKDGIKFKRQYQMAETNYNWNDTTSNLMAPWSPMLVFDSLKNRWSVFHVGYKRKPGSPDVYNMSGRVRRYDALKNGVKGIKGPYKVGNWLDIDSKGPSWEGSAGMLSFSAFPVGEKWYGFIGSNTVPVIQSPESAGGVVTIPETKTYFRASLAVADSITGRWDRVTALNPVLMDDEFIENSLVTKINDHLYINLYDGANKHEISYSTSADGLHWNKEQLLKIPDAPDWLYKTRTPISLISEGNNIYTIYFAAFDGKNKDKVLPLWHEGYGNVGMLKVKLIVSKN